MAGLPVGLDSRGLRGWYHTPPSVEFARQRCSSQLDTSVLRITSLAAFCNASLEGPLCGSSAFFENVTCLGWSSCSANNTKNACFLAVEYKRKPIIVATTTMRSTPGEHSS